MAENEQFSTIINTISDQIRNKTDLSTDDNLDELNAAINQLNILWVGDIQGDLKDSEQQKVLYLLIKTLDLCIKEYDDNVIYNFEISYLCIQSIQEFCRHFPDIIRNLTIDLNQDDDNINFLDVAKKYLNPNVIQLIIEIFLDIIQEIAEYRSNEIYQKLPIDIFFDMFEKCEKGNQNKIFNIIKKMVKNCTVDSSSGQYLNKLLDLTVTYFEQIRKNGIANELALVQINILKNLIKSGGNNTNNSQDSNTESQDESTDFLKYEYVESIFKLLMRLSLPLFNPSVTNNSQKAFKYDEEKKFFIKAF